jgi:hypothetical protein
VNQRWQGSFRGIASVHAIVRSLTVIVKDFSTRRRELFPVLLEAGQNGEIALIQYWTAVPLNVAGACALLLFGSTMLRQGGAGKEERHSADHKDIVVHGYLLRDGSRR